MSTLKVNTIQDASGKTQYLAKAWCNFNGTGTVAINGSGNVSSITDNGAGDYTVNFTNAMSDANYVVAMSEQYDTSGAGYAKAHAAGVAAPYTTGSARVQVTGNVSNTLFDPVSVQLAVFR